MIDLKIIDRPSLCDPGLPPEVCTVRRFLNERLARCSMMSGSTSRS